MLEDIRHVGGRDAGVERDEDGSRERHGVMRGQQDVRIGREHRDTVPRPDAERTQPAGKAQAAIVELGVGEPQAAVDDADTLRKDAGRTLQE